MQCIHIDMDSVTEHRRLQNRLSQRKFRQKRAQEQKLLQTTFELDINDLNPSLRDSSCNDVDLLHDDFAESFLNPSISMRSDIEYGGPEGIPQQTQLYNSSHQPQSMCSPSSSVDRNMGMNMEILRDNSQPDVAVDLNNTLSPAALQYFAQPIEQNIATASWPNPEAENIGDSSYFTQWTRNVASSSTTPSSPAASTKSSSQSQYHRLEASSPISRPCTTITSPSLPPLLHVSAQKGNRGVLQSLLKHGATINERDNYGRTALHVASEYGHEAIVSALLANGADFEALDRDGKSALYLAVCAGHNEIVDVLLRHQQEGSRNNSVFSP